MNPSSLDIKSTSGLNIFISHSHKDEIYARKIVNWLEKVGCSPWASFEECSDKYRVEIDKALLECNIFLLIASQDSFTSVEVRREIGVAGSLNKPIIYYKIDDSSHNREGFLTLLSEKQYIQASRKNLELEKLAINIFETWDGNRNDQIRIVRNKLIQNCITLEEENYQKWRDKLWSLRLDPSGNPRRLSLIDKDILKQYAMELGLIVSINDEDNAFSLNKSSFKRDLTSIIAKRNIDKKMLIQLEKQRIECSVPQNLAISMLQKRLDAINYSKDIKITSCAQNLDHWLVLCLKNISKDELVDLNSSNIFTFEDEIYPLVQYEDSKLKDKMSALLLTVAENKYSWLGLKEKNPISYFY